MDRRGISTLLIPLIAALALLHPTIARKGTSELADTPVSPHRATEAIASQDSQEWHGGRDAIQNWFMLAKSGQGSRWPRAADDPRTAATLTFLIATVPDPIDSGLPHSFDRFVATIQAAVQSQSYFLSDFNLPWDDCVHEGRNGGNETSGGNLNIEVQQKTSGVSITTPADKCGQRRFTQVPGFLLFNSGKGNTKSDSAGDKSKPDLLLVYLVGESPTSGIQQRPLITALNEIADYCDWRKSAAQPVSQASGPKSDNCSQKDIRILGPSFSGSAQSLDFALAFWLDSFTHDPLNLTLISGSATAIDLSPKQDFAATRLRLGSHFSFHSMELPDVISLQKFLEYLSAMDLCLQGSSSIRVALLSEGNTAYGSIVPPTKNKTCTAEVTKIPYPLHISQLRAASERVQRKLREANPQPPLPSKTLSLSDALEDTGQRHDIATFSHANAATSEQVLASILSTISREGYRYVGIFASDVRDTIFLAQEVHEHAPAAVVFTFSADVLFLHPEINPSLRGMLVVSSYPLNSSNQLWSLPSHSGVRLQFPDDTSEGTYNATLALTGHDGDILEFSSPFPRESDIAPAMLRPPVWISVVGTDRLWPTKIYDVNSEKLVQEYTYGIPVGRAGSIEAAFWQRGLYPQGILILLTAVSILCIVFSIPLFRRFYPRSFRVTQPTRGDLQPTSRTSRPQITKTISRAPCWLRSKWLDEALGSPLSEQHRRQGEVFLLAAATSLEAFLIVAGTASSVPQAVIALMFKSSIRESVVGHTFVLLACFLASIILLAGMVFLIRAFKPNKKGWNWGAVKPFTVDKWGPVAATTGLVMLVALLLSAKWLLDLLPVEGHKFAWLASSIQALGASDFRVAMFSSLRSLDLSSGISGLLPLFLISMAGFLWGMTSFHRIRMLEGFESKESFLRLSAIFPEVEIMERKLRRLLQSRAQDLPGVLPIFAAAVFLFIFFLRQFVRSIESGWFYALLGVAYFCVMLALCFAVLRFFALWRQTRHLLEHLAWTPMRTACMRFRSSLPAWPKIDLATPAPSLAPLALAIDQARTLTRRAGRELIRVQTTVNAQPVKPETNPPASSKEETTTSALQGKPEITAPQEAKKEALASTQVLTDDARDALTRIAARDVTTKVDVAADSLTNARTAASVGDWRQVLVSQYESHEALSGVTLEISEALELYWWKELRSSAIDPNNPPPEADSIFTLAEEFLAARVFHLLAHVFPQMQLLIYASVAGILLLLLAISSYPFQPHNLLLLINSAVIVIFVMAALWAFVEMNRDPVLSSLNGTTPGQITWDKQFILRLVLYGVVPMLALLGAHFPETVSQVLSSIASAGGGHP